MYSTAINVNLSKSTPTAGGFVLDADPDGDKAIYSGVVVDDGRLKIDFPDCVAKNQAGTLTICAPGMGYGSIRFQTGQSEGGTLTLVAGPNPFD